MLKLVPITFTLGLLTVFEVAPLQAADKDQEAATPVTAAVAALPRPETAPAPAPPAAIPTLRELQAWRPTLKTVPSNQEPSLRERALRETGLQVGSQAALAAKTRAQNAEVETYAPWLDAIYRFDQLLSEQGWVLPPLLIETRRHAAVKGTQLTQIEQSYKLLENAQVVSAPPTWRDYLIGASYSPPAKPEGALLPQNSAEEAVWSAAVHQGWEHGEQQAWLAFKARVGELHRAFLGRVRYWVLLERGLVTAPAVRITRRGVQQAANELLIGRTDITLSRLPEFRLPRPPRTGKKAQDWQALPEVLTTYDDGSSVQ